MQKKRITLVVFGDDLSVFLLLECDEDGRPLDSSANSGHLLLAELQTRGASGER